MVDSKTKAEPKAASSARGPPPTLAARFYVNGRRVDGLEEERPTVRRVLEAAGESPDEVVVYRLAARHDDQGYRVDPDDAVEPYDGVPVYLQCMDRTDEGRGLTLRDVRSSPSQPGRRTQAAFGPRPNPKRRPP